MCRALVQFTLLRTVVLLLFLLAGTTAHPGGFSDGRGSCGSEYGTAKTAFDVVDVREAWFNRRIATCAQPFFWNTFETKRVDQEVYIAANIPSISRFTDKLEFNGVLFGPGLEEDPADVALPGGIDFPSSYMLIHPNDDTGAVVKLGARVLTAPAAYSTCDFVKNEVMSQFCEVKDGRCVETMTLDDDYKDALIAGLEYTAEWLYSVDHKMASVGQYWLVTWLTDRETGKLANGKFDLTIGPWEWWSYATDATTNTVQSQGSTCQCAFNALEWRESNLDRLSNLPPAALQQALPMATCTGQETTHVCDSAAGKDPMSSDTEIEWSGKFALTPGSTYSWNFHASIGCTSKTQCRTTLPDPAIEVLIVAESTAKAAAKAAGSSIEVLADSTMKKSASITVRPNGNIDLGLNLSSSMPTKSVLTMETIPAGSSDSSVSSFLVTIPPEAENSWWIFTQHVPHEFSANFLTCSLGACKDAKDSSAAYAFPSDTSLYLGASTYVGQFKGKLFLNEKSDKKSASGGSAASAFNRGAMLCIMSAGMITALVAWVEAPMSG
eukprot:g1983.t1